MEDGQDSFSINDVSKLSSYLPVDIVNSLDRRGQLDIAYTDYSKTFYRVNHLVPIRKLSGFHSLKLIDHFRSYLNLMMINGFKSDPYFSASGVPQGYNLGSMFFLLIYVEGFVDIR